MARHPAEDLCVAFSFAVTKSSPNERAWIAKNGSESIFSVMASLIPEVIFFVKGFEFADMHLQS